MPLTRRSFLIGFGAFLSSGFLSEARHCIAETGEPLLLRPPAPAQTLFYYPGSTGEFQEGLRLTLGIDDDAPEPPSWREYLEMAGYATRTPSDFRRIQDEWDLLPSELREPVDGGDWEDQWEARFSPAAKAYDLLKKLDLGPKLNGAQRAGELIFERYPNPMSSAHFVEASDPLSLSLLQARLRELDLPIEIRAGVP